MLHKGPTRLLYGISAACAYSDGTRDARSWAYRLEASLLRYESNKGKAATPLLFPCELSEGKGDFAELVSAVSREIKPHSILKELERCQIVERTKRGLKLKARMYISKKNLEEGFYFLEEDIDDLITAVEENLVNDEALKNLHIKTEYNNIPQSLLPTIKEWLLIHGSAFHEKARNYLSQLDRDINPAVKGSGVACKVAVGSFSILKEPKVITKSTDEHDENF